MDEIKNAPDRISYSESRTINIGDYESIKAELRYTSSIRYINEQENTIEIFASDSADIDEEKEAFEKTIKLVTGRVKKVLNNREIFIRSRTTAYVDHDTDGKALVLKMAAVKAWKKLKHTFNIDKKDINDLMDGFDFDLEEE